MTADTRILDCQTIIESRTNCCIRARMKLFANETKRERGRKRADPARGASVLVAKRAIPGHSSHGHRETHDMRALERSEMIDARGTRNAKMSAASISGDNCDAALAMRSSRFG